MKKLMTSICGVLAVAAIALGGTAFANTVGDENMIDEPVLVETATFDDNCFVGQLIDGEINLMTEDGLDALHVYIDDAVDTTDQTVVADTQLLMSPRTDTLGANAKTWTEWDQKSNQPAMSTRTKDLLSARIMNGYGNDEPADEVAFLAIDGYDDDIMADEKKIGVSTGLTAAFLDYAQEGPPVHS